MGARDVEGGVGREGSVLCGIKSPVFSVRLLRN